jgi:dsRNA-specific ribonuclease
VTVGAKLLARGSGLSKKEAQQLAAKKLLETMKKKGIEL